ncbi:MAG TPA: sulfite exporter TauE/SafE family protein [Candidatus Thermoplasmatota archaeon]|nr:sulfite exporter TauE/SafE family protein [Candidatus Thermoplasmatota archaeon]
MAAIGFSGGVAGGLFGLGGGLVMVPLSVLLLQTSVHDAKAAALLAASFATVPALLTHARAGNVRVVTGVLLAAGGVAGSLLSVLLAELVSDTALRVSFAILLLGAAVRLGMRIAPLDRPVAAPPAVAALVGAAGGLAAGFFGIGGGIVMVPALALLGLPMHAAVGTSLVAVLGNSIAATGGHAALGYGPAMLDLAPALALGALPGALLGAHAAVRIPDARLRAVFAVFLAFVAVALLKNGL